MPLNIKIENTPVVHKDQTKDYTKLSCFMLFIDLALEVNRLVDFRPLCLSVPVISARYFKWGFGGDHFWLADLESNKRILLITEN